MSESLFNAQHPDLCDADCAALEALIAADFDAARVAEPLRERAHRVASVLGILDQTLPPHQGETSSPAAPHDHSALLVDVTLARVARSRTALPPELCVDDHDALELLVSANFAPERVAAGVRSRARKHAALLSLLDDLGAQSVASDRDSLVSATLARVQGTIEQSESRMKLATRPRTNSRWGLADLVSVAAMLLIAGAVLIPMASTMREYGRRSACESNLLAAGLGFSAYAKDFRDALPLASESRAGTPWWNVGRTDQSNSANLFTLARTNYTKLANLACAGNPNACSQPQLAGDTDWRSISQISYSYQNMYAQDRSRWVQPNTVVILADSSPIIPLALEHKMFNPTANSLNHSAVRWGWQGAGLRGGQNALFNDASARFLRSPVLENGDNIYLPRQMEQAIARQQQPLEVRPLQGNESPESASDGFVGP